MNKQTLRLTFFLLTLVSWSNNALSQQPWIHNDYLAKDSVATWSLHGQFTTIYQSHNAFSPKYAGAKSLSGKKEEVVSTTSDIYLGRKLWKGAALYLNPEVVAGEGFSGTTGIASFPNGEIYRIGNPKPTIFLARAYLQQHFALGKTNKNEAPSPMGLAGKRSTSRISITVGKFCLMDFFDDNSASHDARTQFMNWSLMGHGAWDFAADVRGYTSGMVVEVMQPKWELRAGWVQVPTQANSAKMSKSLSESSQILELERNWSANGRMGYITFTGFCNWTRAPKYSDATAQLEQGNDVLAKVISGETVGEKNVHPKYGFGVSLEQELLSGIIAFSRCSWNDGQTATWAFTEIDNSLSLGINAAGNMWHRQSDNFGLAVLSNGISSAHQNYLKAGGYGFMIGDGKLDYAREMVLETFYKAQLSQNVALTADYQLLLNAGYNSNRIGAVHIPSIRLHAEF